MLFFHYFFFHLRLLFFFFKRRSRNSPDGTQPLFSVIFNLWVAIIYPIFWRTATVNLIYFRGGSWGGGSIHRRDLRGAMTMSLPDQTSSLRRWTCVRSEIIHIRAFVVLMTRAAQKQRPRACREMQPLCLKCLHYPRSAFSEIAEAPLLVCDGSAADAQRRVYLQSPSPNRQQRRRSGRRRLTAEVWWQF